MSLNTRTDRFASEYATAQMVQSVAADHGTHISIIQAHQAWAEHSDDYCAGWLSWRSDNPRVEILQALTKYRERHPRAVRESAKMHKAMTQEHT